MRIMNRIYVTILLFFVISAFSSFSTLAQSGGGYELTWTSIDGGGGALSGGAYSLVSSIGQPEPGATQSGGAYSLNGGVIDTGESGETASPEQTIFVPLIQR
jgi:hypothetical protein